MSRWLLDLGSFRLARGRLSKVDQSAAGSRASYRGTVLSLGVDPLYELQRCALLALCSELLILDLCCDDAIVGTVIHGSVSLTYQASWRLVKPACQLVVERRGIVWVLVFHCMPESRRLAYP